MLRLLFVPILAVILFSCDSSADEVDPLFYQISEADSARCMEEILGEMRDEAQHFELSIREPNWPTCVDWEAISRNVLDFEIDSSGEIRNSFDSDDANISNVVVDFFFQKRVEYRNSKDKESLMRKTRGYWTFFFYDKNMLEDQIKQREEQYEAMKMTPGADSYLIDYYKSQVAELDTILSVMNILKADTVSMFSVFTRVQIDANSHKQYAIVFDEVLNAYFQIRNYECLRHFRESYLSLYERAKRLNRSNDLEKLNALNFYRPVRISDKHSPGAISNPHAPIQLPQ